MFGNTHLIGFGDGGGAADSPPLDGIAAAAGAYGTRLLKTGYAGNCIKVRRSSDSTTQDIGFVGTSLDTASIATFCGASNGFIDTWYDQSGNARNFTQATTSAQPKIYDGAAVLANIASKPTLSFDGTAQYLLRAASAGTFFASGAACTVFFLARCTSAPVSNTNVNDNGLVIGSYDNVGNDFGVGFDSGPNMIAGTPSGRLQKSVSALPTTVMGLMRTAALTSGTAGNIYKDGGTPTTGNWSDSSTDTGNTGMGRSTRQWFGGHIAEVYLFTSNLSQGDSNSIGANVAACYGLSWTAI